MPNDDKLTSVFLSIRGGLARAISGIVPPREVEDVVQETYVRVCQSQNTDEIRAPRAFMYRTARNIALNYVNKAESRLVDSLDAALEAGNWSASDPRGDTYTHASSREEFSMFCDAVRSLPLQCRRAFVLKKVYGHSYKEIAEKLGISEKTVEKHIAKGIVRCKTYMSESGIRSGSRQKTDPVPRGRA
jgi:RNA polymerase sigma-70 factor (ECF subfamily)